MLWNAFTLAIGALTRNLVRSGLTMVGIAIGVAVVIVMVTIGAGLRASISQAISGLGSNTLTMTPSATGGGFGGVGLFDVEDAQAIRDQVPSAALVAPIAQRSVMAVVGDESWRTTVAGVDRYYQDIRDWPVVMGRNFSLSEQEAGSAACIVGDTIRTELFGAYSPVGESLRLGKVSCDIVGVLEAKGQSVVGQDQDNFILMPLKAYQRRIANNDDIQSIMVSVRSPGAMDRAKADITRLFRERRLVRAEEDDDFVVQDTREIANALGQVINVLTAGLSALAGVSLLVGGIGIMNIMLVSVTERTREIGTRLAIGALERDVLLQFLVEAAVLSAAGGAVGVIIALGGSAAITSAMKVPFIIDFGVIGLAVAFSAVLGLFFGLVPAQRAAALNPIDALRHE